MRMLEECKVRSVICSAPLQFLRYWDGKCSDASADAEEAADEANTDNIAKMVLPMLTCAS